MVLSSFVEHILHRRADRFVCPVNTADPAARPPHAFFEFGNHSPDMLIPCLLLSDCYSPANPFVAGERRNVFPCCQGLLVHGEGPMQIRWQLMNDAARDFRFAYCHTPILIQNGRRTHILYSFASKTPTSPSTGRGLATYRESVATPSYHLARAPGVSCPSGSSRRGTQRGCRRGVPPKCRYARCLPQPRRRRRLVTSPRPFPLR